MAEAVATSAAYQVELGDIQTADVRVVDTPAHWVLRLTRFALDSRAPKRFPAGPVAAIGGALNQRTRRALAPMAWAGGPGGYTLCCTTPLPPVRDVGVAEQAACLREQSPDTLREQLRQHHGETLPAVWRQAVADPHGWFQAVADASLAAWAALQQHRDAASLAFDREARRVGEALVRGSGVELLNHLHPRLRYTDGVLTLLGTRFVCDRSTNRSSLGDRPVCLVPLFAGPDTLCVDFDNPALVLIGYPARVDDNLAPRPTRLGAVGAPDRLEEILGPARAHVLRRAANPTTAGALAALIGCAPNTASYHYDQLERLGLIIRDRRGTKVWITRTERGARLVEVLSAHGG